jgi:hypothetical protein
METAWLLVYKRIILWNKLPSDFGRNDIAVNLTGCGVRHDEDLVCDDEKHTSMPEILHIDDWRRKGHTRGKRTGIIEKNIRE